MEELRALLSVRKQLPFQRGCRAQGAIPSLQLVFDVHISEVEVEVMAMMEVLRGRCPFRSRRPQHLRPWAHLGYSRSFSQPRRRLRRRCLG